MKFFSPNAFIHDEALVVRLVARRGWAVEILLGQSLLLLLRVLRKKSERALLVTCSKRV